jgi:hypothetical protein
VDREIGECVERLERAWLDLDYGDGAHTQDASPTSVTAQPLSLVSLRKEVENQAVEFVRMLTLYPMTAAVTRPCYGWAMACRRVETSSNATR